MTQISSHRAPSGMVKALHIIIQFSQSKENAIKVLSIITRLAYITSSSIPQEALRTDSSSHNFHNL